MDFKEIESLPESTAYLRRCVPHGRMHAFLEKFIDSGFRIAKIVDWKTQYCTTVTIQCRVKSVANGYRMPIDCKMINGELYLIRTDMGRNGK